MTKWISYNCHFVVRNTVHTCHISTFLICFTSCSGVEAVLLDAFLSCLSFSWSRLNCFKKRKEKKKKNADICDKFTIIIQLCKLCSVHKMLFHNHYCRTVTIHSVKLTGMSNCIKVYIQFAKNNYLLFY